MNSCIGQSVTISWKVLEAIPQPCKDIILGLDAESVTKTAMGGPSFFVALIANLVSSTCL